MILSVKFIFTLFFCFLRTPFHTKGTVKFNGNQFEITSFLSQNEAKIILFGLKPETWWWTRFT